MSFEKWLNESKKLNEDLKWITVWQDKHKSSIGYKKSIEAPFKYEKAFVTGNIPHGAEFTFDKKDVPTIIKLLKMKDSPLVKD